MNDYEKQELLREQSAGPYVCAIYGLSLITALICLCIGIMIGIGLF